MKAPIRRVLPTPVARAKQREGNSRSKVGDRRELAADGRQRSLQVTVFPWRRDLRDAVEDFQGTPLRRAQAQTAGNGVDVAVHSASSL